MRLGVQTKILRHGAKLLRKEKHAGTLRKENTIKRQPQTSLNTTGIKKSSDIGERRKTQKVPGHGQILQTNLDIKR